MSPFDELGRRKESKIFQVEKHDFFVKNTKETTPQLIDKVFTAF